MTGLLSLSRLIDALNEKVGKGIGWLIILATFICAGNAIIRKVFNESSNAYLEIQWYLFGAVFLLGAAYTYLKNEHVRIDVISGKLSEKGRAIIEILGIVLFLTPLTVIILHYGIPYFMDSFSRGEMSSDAGGLIRWPAKLSILLGFFLLQLQAISELIKRLAILTGHREEYIAG